MGARWAHRRDHRRDGLFWGVSLAVFIATAVTLVDFTGEHETAPSRGGAAQVSRSEESSLEDQPQDESLKRSSASDEAKSAQGAQDQDAPALLWWIDEGVIPDRAYLTSCLSVPNQTPVEVMKGNQGYTVVTPGRARPQTIYLRKHQLWLKTPAHGHPHAQAYDHLALASCLRMPRATLYDPLLVRQWSGDEWPSREVSGGGFSLDHLFVIRSEQSAHYTYGLTRLGIPELGLLSSAPQAREALRHLARLWLLDQAHRERVLNDKGAAQINERGVTLSFQSSRQLEMWLGPAELYVVSSKRGAPLSEQETQDYLAARLARAKSERQAQTRDKKTRKRKTRKRKTRKKKTRKKKTRKKKTRKKKTRREKTRDKKNQKRGQETQTQKPSRRDLLRYE